MIGSKERVTAVYDPLPWQIDPWLDQHQIMLLTGSAGGGKSRLAAEKINAFCKRYSGTTGLMLRKAREFCNKSIVPFFNNVVVGDDSTVQFKKSDYCFEYDNGSVLWWGGMKDDAQREAIRSIGQDGSLDIIWLEEANAFSYNDFQELLGRLRGKAANWRQMILTTNPDTPTHWIKKQLMDGGRAKVYYSGAIDNQHNPPEYLETLASLDGLLGDRLNKGLWVQAEGVVYKNFSDELHVLDRFEIPADWTRYRVIDFGYSNPFVCQWWAMDNDGRLYLYREIYMTQRLVEDHAADIKRLSKGEKIAFTVADHDAEDRATLDRYGVYTSPAKKAITPGIQAVENRLKVAGDGKPRMFVLRDSLVEIDQRLIDQRFPTCTLEEFPAYVWPEGKDGKPLKETPVDLHNHGMDCTRYITMELENSGSFILFGG
jgi:PBSX family phage terminase large subunit